MGSKSAAKALMDAAGVPILPGYHGESQSLATLTEAAAGMGFPLLIKPVAGGGGKGMRVVREAGELAEAIAAAQREAQASFGDPGLLLERFLTRPRHVEVQVFCDTHGNGVYLYERDCSIQRRHQKIIEEAPAPGLDPALRRSLGDTAVQAALAIDYTGAGTVEFLLDEDGRFYFMEMNTRLQVEHPVTEMVTGLDLVDWQLQVAAGARLPLAQADIPLRGHAVEMRLYAEDPERDFLPATGTIADLHFPAADAHTRIDTGVRAGDAIGVHYDPMIAKIIVHDRDRGAALRRAARALADTRLTGLRTNRDFLRAIVSHPAFVAANLDTHFIERHAGSLAGDAGDAVAAACATALWLAAHARDDSGQDPWAASPAFRLNLPRTGAWRFRLPAGQDLDIQLRADDPALTASLAGAGPDTDPLRLERLAGDGMVFSQAGLRRRAWLYRRGQAIDVFLDGAHLRLQWLDPRQRERSEQAGSGSLAAPMPGTVTRLLVSEGQTVEPGQALLILEAMKMEHTVRASIAGTVARIHFGEGDTVPSEGMELLAIDPDEE